MTDTPTEPAAVPPPGAVTVPRPPERPPTPPSSPVVNMAGTFYAVVGLFAFGYALFGDGLATLFGDKAPGIGGILGGLGIGVVVVAVSRLGVKMWPAVHDAARTLSVMLGPLTRKDALLLALFSGVAEELLFRGALWSHMHGIWGTSLLFGLVHIVPKKRLWAYPVFAVAAGFLLGLLREATGSVIPCMLAHFVINALNLIYLGDHHEAFAQMDAASRADGPTP